jgi:hypothetical protein
VAHSVGPTPVPQQKKVSLEYSLSLKMDKTFLLPIFCLHSAGFFLLSLLPVISEANDLLHGEIIVSHQ